MVLERIHVCTYLIPEKRLLVCFRVNRAVRCILLEVGRVYLEHTTLCIPSETTTSNRRIMLFNNYFFTVSIY